MHVVVHSIFLWVFWCWQSLKWYSVSFPILVISVFLSFFFVKMFFARGWKFYYAFQRTSSLINFLKWFCFLFHWFLLSCALISFLLLTFGLFCSSLSRFLEWELRWLIQGVSFFLLYAFHAVKFSQPFFSYVPQILIAFPFSSFFFLFPWDFLPHGLFRSMLFRF